MFDFHSFFCVLVTGIARSVNPGQSLRSLKPISGKTNDIQVLRHNFYLLNATFNTFYNTKIINFREINLKMMKIVLRL